MKKLEKYLKLAILIELCLCAGRILFRWLDYMLHSLTYAVQSVPWYLDCVVTLVTTGVLVGITVIAYFVVRHKNKTMK